MILARMFPDAEIVGVDIDPNVLSIAHARLDHFGFGNVHLRLLESSDLTEDLGLFDSIVCSALYEHLLPNERKAVMPRLWALLKTGGVLFIGETPHRYSPIEWHTTRLPIYRITCRLALALRAARAFSPRVLPSPSWEQLLRSGIRGGTRGRSSDFATKKGREPVVLEPTRLGLRDTIDLWYTLATDAPIWLRRFVRQLSSQDCTQQRGDFHTAPGIRASKRSGDSNDR